MFWKKNKKNNNTKELIEMKMYKGIKKQLDRNYKEIQIIKDLDLKKKALIDEIIVAREFVSIEEKISDNELKKKLMNDNIDELIELFEEIVKIIEKKLGSV